MTVDEAKTGARVRVSATRQRIFGPTYAGRLGTVVREPYRLFPDTCYVELDPAPRERVRKVEVVRLDELHLLEAAPALAAGASSPIADGDAT